MAGTCHREALLCLLLMVLGSSQANDELDAVLAAQKGKTVVDCMAVCQAVAGRGTYRGSQYRSDGNNVVSTCKCTSAGSLWVKDTIVTCVGNPFESCGLGQSAASPEMVQTNGGQLPGNNSGAPGLDEILAGLQGKERVECDQVCQAVGGTYHGYRSQFHGGVQDFSCMCGTEGDVTISCLGKPYLRCCKDKCEGVACPGVPQGWQCPAGGGCPGGNCDNDGYWQEWVAAHNIYRCMHDVPPIVWSHAVFADANETFAGESTLRHSQPYEVQPPAGPAGENLFQANGPTPPLSAVHLWYSEVDKCGSYPGCDEGKLGVVGHFTAMVWQGGRELGCLQNEHNIGVCRYKGKDFKSCHTPNFGGDDAAKLNVFERKYTYSECLDKVEACGLPVKAAKYADFNKVSGLSGVGLALTDAGEEEIKEDIGAAVHGRSSARLLLAGVSAMGLVAGAIAWRRRWGDVEGIELLQEGYE